MLGDWKQINKRKKGKKLFFLAAAIVITFNFGRALGGVAIGSADAMIETSHQYPWSEWVTVNDGKSNGIQFAFRKGDNNFIERGMVFVRIYNRYKTTVSGDVMFIIVNNTTGAESREQDEVFYMKAESLKEDGGSWFLVPGNNEKPDVWGRASLSLRGIRIRNFRVN